MNVTGKEDYTIGLSFLDEIKKALSLVEIITPFVHALSIGNDLDAGAYQTQFGWKTELLFKPGPLGFAEKRDGAVFVRRILADLADLGPFFY